MIDISKNITKYFLKESDISERDKEFNAIFYEKPDRILKIDDILDTNFMSTSKKQLADNFVLLNNIIDVLKVELGNEKMRADYYQNKLRIAGHDVSIPKEYMDNVISGIINNVNKDIRNYINKTTEELIYLKVNDMIEKKIIDIGSEEISIARTISYLNSLEYRLTLDKHMSIKEKVAILNSITAQKSRLKREVATLKKEVKKEKQKDIKNKKDDILKQNAVTTDSFEIGSFEL